MLFSQEVLGKKGRGRPKTYSLGTFEEKFKKYETEIIICGELAKLNSDVYQKLADELKLGSKKAAFLACQRYVKKKIFCVCLKKNRIIQMKSTMTVMKAVIRRKSSHYLIQTLKLIKLI